VARTLEAVQGQAIDQPFEVIVIDSGSTDRTLELVRRFDVRLIEIEPGRFSFGYALNLGARQSRGEIVVNLSAHCIPTGPGWMASLVAPLLADPDVAASHGRQVPLAGLNPYEERLLLAAFAPGPQGDVQVEFSNSNCAVRRSVLERNPFDEEAAFAEDFIWARRLPARQRIVYVPDAAVYHSHPLSLRYWAQRYYRIGLQERYMEQVYGLRFPPSAGDGGGFLREPMSALWFLLRRGYLLHLLAFPVYFALRRLSYHRGLREGALRWGPRRAGKA